MFKTIEITKNMALHFDNDEKKAQNNNAQN